MQHNSKTTASKMKETTISHTINPNRNSSFKNWESSASSFTGDGEASPYNNNNNNSNNDDDDDKNNIK